ncbi:MAG TPA: AAA family ATPase, partial [Chitinophagaceae bacterium]|nr:AAA family ATPase [Chitinophagaceae bacterium]
MLRLDSISVTQFKNYSTRSFTFPERITGICGNNGVGKTNLLDAIHYLCFTKSCFTRDSLNSLQGRSGFRIEGHFKLGEKEEKAICILRETGKKEFSVNDELYERFSHHIGHYPGVMIGPDDSRLITGGSEERRRFLDELISQLDAVYLQNLINYNKVLVQRNSQLRHLAMTGSQDHSLLEVLDEQLSKPGTGIA